MNDTPPVAITGSGKYILVNITRGTSCAEILRGGSEYKMHKDIADALHKELGEGSTIRVRGGGALLFMDGERKMIVVSGESLKYGPPDSIIAVLSLLEAAYPEYDILSK